MITRRFWKMSPTKFRLSMQWTSSIRDTWCRRVFDSCGPFYQHGLSLIQAWINNYIHCKVWDEIIYRFLIFNGANGSSSNVNVVNDRILVHTSAKLVPVCSIDNTKALVYGFAPRQAVPDSKVHGANMGPTWVLSAPDGPHDVPMNLALRGYLNQCWPRCPMTYHKALLEHNGLNQSSEKTLSTFHIPGFYFPLGPISISNKKFYLLIKTKIQTKSCELSNYFVVVQASRRHCMRDTSKNLKHYSHSTIQCYGVQVYDKTFVW